MRSTPLAGVFTLICMGLAAGTGNTGISRAQAHPLETARNQGTPALAGSPSRRAHMGSPARVFPSTPLVLAGDDASPPAPHSALPSRSTATSPTGTTSPVNGGRGDVRSPASQASHMRATGSHTLTLLLPIASAQNDSPPHAGAANALALLTAAAATQGWYAQPQGARLDLSSALTTLHDRTNQLSSLGLERLLDGQTFSSGTLPVLSRGQEELPADLAATSQRQPAALGLRLAGTRPGATQYQQPPAPVTAGAVATATPTPPPTAAPPQPTGTPQPTEVPPQPTPSPAYAKAGLVSTATPSSSVAAANWTAQTMPGGNARSYFITGYTWTGSQTATGTYPHWGTVAVDPHVIPLGATVYIQGLGIFHAEDTGGAIIGDHIDVFVGSDAQAYQITGHRLVSWTN